MVRSKLIRGGEMKRKFKRAILVIVVVIATFFLASCGCASCERWRKDCTSEMNNGINREINIYTYDGTLIAHYEGKMDIETGHSEYIVFHIDGERYIYYYGIGIIEVIEK